jgi:hypothetical protein
VHARADLDEVTKEKNSRYCPCRELNPGLSAHSQVRVSQQQQQQQHEN